MEKWLNHFKKHREGVSVNSRCPLHSQSPRFRAVENLPALDSSVTSTIYKLPSAAGLIVREPCPFAALVHQQALMVTRLLTLCIEAALIKRTVKDEKHNVNMTQDRQELSSHLQNGDLLTTSHQLLLFIFSLKNIFFLEQNCQILTGRISGCIYFLAL